MGYAVLIVLCITKIVKSDVSHLFDHGYPSHADSLPSTTTTEEYFIPEIIINRKTALNNNNFYNYEKPIGGYLPPPNEVPIDHYLPPQAFPQPIPIPLPPLDPSPIPPAYLPPSTQYPQDIFQNFAPNIIPGYDYNQPQFPIHTTTSPTPIFIPGQESDIPENHPPSPTYLPPGPTYLPPHFERSFRDFNSFNGNAKNPIRLQLNDMRCVHSQGGFFKTVITVQSFLGAVPIVDSDILDSRCDLRLVKTQLLIDIAAEDFGRCGVQNCGANLCLRIRFPQLRGMKTSSDSILTLQCKPQDKIVTKTHSVRMAISNSAQARSLGAYAQGGGHQPFRTQIELLKKASEGFTRLIEPHGIVQLGDELLLRAHANSGDGWNFTRLSDVQLQRIAPSGEIVNSAILIKSSGCVNPSMRSICPVSPTFEPPLGHRLGFKAVMFQGMRSGDEMMITVKITGCIEQKDCIINAKSCENPPNPPGLARFRRKAESNLNDVKNLTEYSEVSTIMFRVELPNFQRIKSSPGLSSDNFNLIAGGVLGFICFLSLIAALAAYVKCTRP